MKKDNSSYPYNKGKKYHPSKLPLLMAMPKFKFISTKI